MNYFFLISLIINSQVWGNTQCPDGFLVDNVCQESWYASFDSIEKQHLGMDFAIDSRTSSEILDSLLPSDEIDVLRHDTASLARWADLDQYKAEFENSIIPKNPVYDLF